MFLCCYVKHINLVKIHPERVTQEDKKLVNSLNYAGIEFQHSTFNIQHSTFNIQNSTFIESQYINISTYRPL